MKLLIKKLLSRIPGPLPVGMKEFEKWAKDVLDISGRFADEDSMLFALASMVIHADARHGFLSKHYFVVRLRKVAANQVASQVFQNIKNKQAEAAEKLKQETINKQADEVTPAPQETLNGEQKRLQ